ncbi:protein kinase [Streptomyces sp. NPDC085927]|uniref:protein kinase domain-containing protein n=1 Tax=Streptomyces sp. NPDC085927 TaxID=3365738 RepID=UPI0037D7B38D
MYLGESPGGEPAAVKVIKPSVVDSGTRTRFAQEVEILKTIRGARIAALLDADPDAERPWPATEYVEGLDLSRRVAAHGPLPALLTAALGATPAEALVTVHRQGLLHRDLKPANVLLGPNGPKVIDFGLAVFAESSVAYGQCQDAGVLHGVDDGCRIRGEGELARDPQLGEGRTGGLTDLGTNTGHTGERPFTGRA